MITAHGGTGIDSFRRLAIGQKLQSNNGIFEGYSSVTVNIPACREFWDALDDAIQNLKPIIINPPKPPEEGTVTSAGQVWMDRNLGASRVATSPTDVEAYGDLYQWGRGTDGHEKRTSSTTLT